MRLNQLNAEERLELYRLQQETELLLRAIAKKMGRSHTTISRELQRNQDPHLKTYLPDSATSQAQERRQNAFKALPHNRLRKSALASKTITLPNRSPVVSRKKVSFPLDISENLKGLPHKDFRLVGQGD
jgi:IS30 family transposase